MKILHLILKQKWFDLIDEEIKLEEYRDLKPFWIKRLVISNMPEESKGENKWYAENIYFDIVVNKFPWQQVLKSYCAEFKDFDHVMFQHGYAKNAPRRLYAIREITIGTAVPEWSDNWQGDVFIIKLGNRIK